MAREGAGGEAKKVSVGRADEGEEESMLTESNTYLRPCKSLARSKDYKTI